MVGDVTADRYSTGYFQGRKTQLLIFPSVGRDCQILAARKYIPFNNVIPVSIVNESQALRSPYEYYRVGSNTTHNLLQLVHG